VGKTWRGDRRKKKAYLLPSLKKVPATTRTEIGQRFLYMLGGCYKGGSGNKRPKEKSRREILARSVRRVHNGSYVIDVGKEGEKGGAGRSAGCTIGDAVNPKNTN